MTASFFSDCAIAPPVSYASTPDRTVALIPALSGVRK
jgi:hypothetical protein